MRANNIMDLWSYEQESVQSDYHAMFKQLKRLKDLCSLHIYNSPALNSSANPGDPYQEGAAAPWMPDGAFFIGGPTVDTSVDQSSEALEDESLAVSSSPSSPSLFGFQGADEGSSSGLNRGEETNESQDVYLDEDEEEEPSLYSEDQANDDPSNSDNSSNGNAWDVYEDRSHILVHPHRSQAPTTATVTATVPSPVHPFSLRTGLKALERLTKLESLTLYERSNIPFGAAEARWISKAFPQLSLLQLRGAIEISDKVLDRLTAKRPDLKVQVCSLFE
ncbi:hypothetical protein BGZ72_009303 [Mortierella alpina]|nr:hypothetical protein BGZ72_009303 [Mortierella alpina]